MSRCYSEAADAMMAPGGYMAGPAFAHLRWSLAGDQRSEVIRLFCRKLLRRLDDMSMPFYPAVGLMNHKVAQQRYVTGVDPWKPIESPFLDGTAIEFRHALLPTLERRQWYLFAEIGFDVARLAQLRVVWGGFADPERPGLFQEYEPGVGAVAPADRRTYGVRNGADLEYMV